MACSEWTVFHYRSDRNGLVRNILVQNASVCQVFSAAPGLIKSSDQLWINPATNEHRLAIHAHESSFQSSNIVTFHLLHAATILPVWIKKNKIKYIYSKTQKTLCLSGRPKSAQIKINCRPWNLKRKLWCVCVCVCVWERERIGFGYGNGAFSWATPRAYSHTWFLYIPFRLAGLWRIFRNTFVLKAATMVCPWRCVSLKLLVLILHSRPVSIHGDR